MWIQLLAQKTIESRGKSTRYQAGDWVDVGKQTALLWLSDGSAVVPEITQAGLDLSGAGILTDHKELLCSRLKESLKNVPVHEGPPCLPYEKTVILDSTLPFRVSLIPVGLSLLETWDMAVPLMDYKTLAIHVEGEQERELTKKIIHDLRVPVYDTRLMFVKRTDDTERLIDNWRNQGKGILAFLREVYQIKPLILALPCTWTSSNPVKQE